MAYFLEFIDRKQRAAKKHLELIEKILKKGGLDVKPYLDEENPYVFVRSTKDTSFEGIRIYEIGDSLAYRVQREPKTHPYGKSYSLDLEEMFSDFMSDNIDEEMAAKKVMESVVNELKKFFEKSAEAEDELGHARELPGSQYILKTGGSDYSSLVLNKM